MTTEYSTKKLDPEDKDSDVGYYIITKEIIPNTIREDGRSSYNIDYKELVEVWGWRKKGIALNTLHRGFVSNQNSSMIKNQRVQSITLRDCDYICVWGKPQPCEYCEYGTIYIRSGIGGCDCLEKKEKEKRLTEEKKQ